MEREEAIKWLKNCALSECEDCKYINKPDDWCDIQVMRIARMLETLPNNLVRCKDCRYAMVRTKEEMNKPIKPQPILCEWFCIGVENDDYCSHGERREP